MLYQRDVLIERATCRTNLKAQYAQQQIAEHNEPSHQLTPCLVNSLANEIGWEQITLELLLLLERIMLLSIRHTNRRS